MSAKTVPNPQKRHVADWYLGTVILTVWRSLGTRVAGVPRDYVDAESSTSTWVAAPLATATAARDAFGLGPLRARAARKRPERPRFDFEIRSGAHLGTRVPNRQLATKRSR